MLGFISGVVVSSLLLISLTNGRLIQVVGELQDNQHGTISKNGKYVSPAHVQVSWEAAQSYCESHYGTDLASIYSHEDEIEFFDLIQSLYAISVEVGLPEAGIPINLGNIWIGANDIDNNNEWEWINNYGYKEEITYENWCQSSGLLGRRRRRMYGNNNYNKCGNINIQYGCWEYGSCNYDINQVFVCNYNSRPTRSRGRRGPPCEREPYHRPC